MKNVAGKPYSLKVGTKIVGANFFRLSESEFVDEDTKPNSIEDFPQRLQELIDKYEPVNPQNLAEELRNLQRAFEDSQSKLTEDVKYLKDQVSSVVHDLTRESIKREHETNMLTRKVEGVEIKINELTRDNIRFDERMSNMGTVLSSIDERTKKINEELIGDKAEKKEKNKVATTILTVFISIIATVVAGIILYLVKMN